MRVSMRQVGEGRGGWAAVAGWRAPCGRLARDLRGDPEDESACVARFDLSRSATEPLSGGAKSRARVFSPTMPKKVYLTGWEAFERDGHGLSSGGARAGRWPGRCTRGLRRHQPLESRCDAETIAVSTAGRTCQWASG